MISNEEQETILELFKCKYTVTMKSRSKGTSIDDFVVKEIMRNYYPEQDQIVDSLMKQSKLDIKPSEFHSVVHYIIEASRKAAFDKYQQQLKARPSTMQVFEDLFKLTVKEYNIVCNASMSQITRKDKATGFTSQIDVAELESLIKATNIIHAKGLKSDDIKHLLISKVSNARLNLGGTVCSSIMYEPGHEDNADKCLKGMYDHFGITEDYDIFKAIMYQWLWQVKRKLANKDISWPIWPHFYGAAGIGKTRTIEDLVDAVMSDFRTTTTLSKIFENTKEIKRMTTYYVWVIDELALGNKAEEQSDGCLTGDQKSILKSMLTSKDIDARIYGTQDIAKKSLTFSCISSANVHFADVIFDETTMRRFFEFTCTATKPQSADEWDSRTTFKQYFVDLWKDVDDSLPNGYVQIGIGELGRRINEIQESYYPTNTTIMKWLNEYEIIPGGSITKTYEIYNDWCKESGFRCKNKDNFEKELRHRFPQFIDSKGRFKCDVVAKTDPELNNGMSQKELMDQFIEESKKDEQEYFEKQKAKEEPVKSEKRGGVNDFEW